MMSKLCRLSVSCAVLVFLGGGVVSAGELVTDDLGAIKETKAKADRLKEENIELKRLISDLENKADEDGLTTLQIEESIRLIEAKLVTQAVPRLPTD